MDLGMPEVGLGTSHPRAVRDVKEEECGTCECERVFQLKAAEPFQEWEHAGSVRRELMNHSGFHFEDSSALESGRERGVLETSKQRWRGRRARTAQGAGTRREGRGWSTSSGGWSACLQDSCICNEVQHL